MNIRENTEASNNKMLNTKNKAQYTLDRQTAKISALVAGNFSKHEFVTGKDVFTEKDLLRKVATLKRFEYLLLGKTFEKQTNVSKNRLRLLITNKTKEINS